MTALFCEADRETRKKKVFFYGKYAETKQ